MEVELSWPPRKVGPEAEWACWRPNPQRRRRLGQQPWTLQVAEEAAQAESAWSRQQELACFRQKKLWAQPPTFPPETSQASCPASSSGPEPFSCPTSPRALTAPPTHALSTSAYDGRVPRWHLLNHDRTGGCSATQTHPKPQVVVILGETMERHSPRVISPLQ